MTDDAEHLLHGTACSSIPTTTTTTATTPPLQCQCQCSKMIVPESDLKMSWCQKTTEQHGNMTCCHCCHHHCCCCAHAKNRTKPDRTAEDLLHKPSSQSQMNGSTEQQSEDDEEEQAVPFNVEANIVEYRHKVNNNNNNNNENESLNYLPMPAINEGVDATLRYSFKGIPPETYSAKKEFIYTRPLVEKQVS